jgi:hypothetical protein
LVVALAVVGCGGGDDDTTSTSQGGSSGSGGSAATGGSGGSGASGGSDANAGTGDAGTTSNAGMKATGGGGGSDAAGRGGSGGTGGTSSAGKGGTGGAGGSAGADPGTDCSTAAFGAPTLLFNGETGEIPQSLSITGDDLELFYELEDRTNGSTIVVRRRATRDDDFGAPEVVSFDVPNVCDLAVGPSIDVSDDGLHLYTTCVNTDVTPILPGPIRVAKRSSRSTPAFTVDPMTYGMGNVSLSVSADELTAFFSDYTNIDAPVPLTATRSALTEPFGSAGPIPGVTGDVLRQPELSSDGLVLFGSIDEGTGLSHLVRYSRTSKDGDFGMHSASGLPVPPVIADDPNTPSVEGVDDFSPTVSADCKSLYFLRYTHLAGGQTITEIFGARR